MMTLFQIILSLLVLALLVPVAVLLLQVLAAIGKRAVVIAPGGRRPEVAVLVPAHNEAQGIAATVAGIRAQLRAGDRILVCLLYTSPSPRDRQKSRMPSSA